MFAELKSTVTDTKQAVVDLQNVLVKQYSQMLDSIAQLNQKVIGEVREQHYGMEELSRKVDLLMNNHKEITTNMKRLDKTHKEKHLSWAMSLTSC